MSRRPLRLSLAGFIQRDVALPLKTPFGVPDRLAVPQEHEPYLVAQLGLPGLVTSSGSGMVGQSFQIRSSA